MNSQNEVWLNVELRETKLTHQFISLFEVNSITQYRTHLLEVNSISNSDFWSKLNNELTEKLTHRIHSVTNLLQFDWKVNFVRNVHSTQLTSWEKFTHKLNLVLSSLCGGYEVNFRVNVFEVNLNHSPHPDETCPITVLVGCLGFLLISLFFSQFYIIFIPLLFI